MKPKVHTFKNGLRVLLLPQPQAPTATALILVGAGSTYETKAQSGLSHFLEHMCFKGTDRFPNAQAITETFESLGAISNAFTTHEYTGYYAKGSPKHIGTFIDVLSDIYLHSTFPDTEIKKEKGVVIEEINMYEDMPQQKVGLLLLDLMYGDQPAGWPVIGNKETVMSFTRDDLMSYVARHYHAENTLVVLAGAIDPIAVRTKVKNAFGAIPIALRTKKKKVIEKQTTVAVRVITKESDQAHIAIGFRALPLGHKDAPTLSLLATILGRGMSSRLFQKLREELGVAYYVGASAEAFTDHGIFEISAGLDKNRLEEVLQEITAVLREIKTRLVSDQELTKAREYTLGMMRLGLESSDDMAGFYGAQLLLKGTIETPDEITRKYKAVTPQGIRKLAQKLFISSKCNLAIVGPHTDTTTLKTPFLSL